jgi:hypothetical protein
MAQYLTLKLSTWPNQTSQKLTILAAAIAAS